jgi:hypothetical protein
LNCSCSRALQLIAAIAQPLPDRGGFYDGGYTGSGPERNSPGPVHYDEYVPKKVLFSNDPVVPNIVVILRLSALAKPTNTTRRSQQFPNKSKQFK